MKTLSGQEDERDLMTTLLCFASLVTINGYEAVRNSSLTYFSAVYAPVNAPGGSPRLRVCPTNITSIVVAVIIVLRIAGITPRGWVVIRETALRPD